MSDFWLGVLATFGTVGGLVVAAGLVWLVVVCWPEAVWWTVKRLPLQSDDQRDRAASTVGASRRAYVLRIPLGVRLILALGGSRNEQQELYENLHRARRLAKEPADV